MKYLLIILVFFSCKQRLSEAEPTNTIKLVLAKNLPFKEVKLKKFDPVYGSYMDFDYQSSKSKDTFIFKLNILEQTSINLFDTNDIGAGTVFLVPNENITAKLYWDDNKIKKQIIESRWQGNNIFYQSIHDSIQSLLQDIKKDRKIFRERASVDDYVEKKFAQTVVPAMNYFSDLKMTPEFYERVLMPQLSLIKNYNKNELIKKSSHEKKWKKFYADSIFFNPNYIYWNYNYNEYGYFKEYLFEVINHGQADNLESFLQNIEKFYKTRKDSVLTRIAISQGLFAFAEKYNPKKNDKSLFLTLDSFSRKYNLDKRKYNFHSSNISLSEPIGKPVLDSIILNNLENENIVQLSKIINDTSCIYYIDYWASWCKPCIKGIPYTVDLFKKKIPHLTVLLFSTDMKRNDFIAASKKYHLPEAQTYNVKINNSSSNIYTKLNPRAEIPAYQLIFFYKSAWRVLNASSSEDPALIGKIEDLKKMLNN